jgi:hypothetical protein
MLAGMDTSGMHTMPGGPHGGRSVWTIIGITLAVVLGIGGLAVAGVMVVLFVGLSHWASNK